MDDDSLEPKDIVEPEEDDELDTDPDDLLAEGKKKPKKIVDNDSLDVLADDEEEVLPEDSFDDVDLW